MYLIPHNSSELIGLTINVFLPTAFVFGVCFFSIQRIKNKKFKNIEKIIGVLLLGNFILSFFIPFLLEGELYYFLLAIPLLLIFIWFFFIIPTKRIIGVLLLVNFILSFFIPLLLEGKLYHFLLPIKIHSIFIWFLFLIIPTLLFFISYFFLINKIARNKLRFFWQIIGGIFLIGVLSYTRLDPFAYFHKEIKKSILLAEMVAEELKKTPDFKTVYHQHQEDLNYFDEIVEKIDTNYSNNIIYKKVNNYNMLRLHIEPKRDKTGNIAIGSYGKIIKGEYTVSIYDGFLCMLINDSWQCK